MARSSTENEMELVRDQSTKPGKHGSNNAAKKLYAKELRRLQIELVKLQEWIRTKGLKVVVVFEGRDAAGKGGSSNASPKV